MTAKSAAEIGEATGTGDYPKFDKSWDYWLAVSNPNASKLSDHDICVVHTKNMLDDSGQKWFHKLEQLEIHRLFARARNPELESIASRQGIFKAFKRQVNQCLRSACRLQKRLQQARPQARRPAQNRLAIR